MAQTTISAASNGVSLPQTNVYLASAANFLSSDGYLTISFPGQTTITSGSDGAILPQSTINVVSTSTFSTSGSLFFWPDGYAAPQIITYTGKTSTTFTGCTGGNAPLAFGDLLQQNPVTIYYTTLLNNSTTITLGSNGLVLPQSTINVSSTVGFTTTGTILVTTNLGVQTVNYTNTTGTSFTGCTGGVGTMSTGGSVTQIGSTGCIGGLGTLVTGYSVYQQPSIPVSVFDLNSTITTDTVSHDPFLIENSLYDCAVPIYYKIRGKYPGTGHYETFVVVGVPTDLNPVTDHLLVDTKIVASWIGETVTAYVSST